MLSSWGPLPYLVDDNRALAEQFYELIVKPWALAVNAGNTLRRRSTRGEAFAPRERLDVEIVANERVEKLAALKEKPGKNIWLFGGGALFRSLAEAKIVDTVEVSVVPVLLGSGVPLAPNPDGRIKLVLKSHKVYRSGGVSLEYAVA